MNNINTNYSSLTIEYKENNELNVLTGLKSFFSNIFIKKIGINTLLNSLNINFKKIKSLTCNYTNYNTNSKIEYFYKSVLPCFDKNNLLYLKLSNFIFYENSGNLDIINDFVSLRTLHLDDFRLDKKLILNITNLENITLFKCTNISFDEKIWPNIKYLKLNDTYIDNEKLIKLPNLVSLILCEDIIYEKKLFNINIDFSSLQKLEHFNGNMFAIYLKLLLKNKNLDSDKEININNNYIKIMEKIISIKTLKSININLINLDKDNIKNIKGENYSITDLKVFCNAESGCLLYDLQKKFPNVSSIYIENINSNYFNNFKNPSLEIIEDENCKINKINLKLYRLMNKSFKIYCQSFENLIELKIELLYGKKTDICLEKVFIIFDKNNKIIFRALKKFSYIDDFYENPPMNELNAINFNCMPNLNDLTIICRRSFLNFTDFKKIIEKILLLNIRNIELKISTYYERNYTFSQLRELFPNINFNKYIKLLIEKYKDKI